MMNACKVRFERKARDVVLLSFLARDPPFKWKTRDHSVLLYCTCIIYNIHALYVAVLLYTILHADKT